MGEHIELTARDGVKIGAYLARPTGAPKGGIVVIQEIFGVNHHIRATADLYASHGYVAVAPAIYDRVQKNYETGYEQADVQAGAALRGKCKNEDFMADIAAAIAKASEGGKVGIVGYCLGGTLTFLSACNLSGLSAAVGYYGGGIAAACEQKPKVPTVLFFGETDHSIPMSDVEKIKAARPEVESHVFMGVGHGFNCDERGAYNKEAADAARKIALDHFAKHL